MYWESKGKEVPTRDLILNEEQIEGIRRAGVVNTGVLDEVAKQIHVGMNTQEIDDICMAYCEAHGAIPVWGILTGCRRTNSGHFSTPVRATSA